MKTAYLLVISLTLTFVLGAFGLVSIERIIQKFPWGILIILISLEILTKLIIRTKSVEVLAVYLGAVSKGNKILLMIIFSALLFAVSSVLNNITAIMVITPVIFVLMESISLSRYYAIAFFSMLLAISNLSGASTPIGDFPAIIIMKSGLTTFADYLVRAFPLFFTTGVIIVASNLIFYKLKVSEKQGVLQSQQEIGIRFMQLQYMNYKIKKQSLLKILTVFALMFTGWIILPPERFPPEIIAISGVAIAVVILGKAGREVLSEPFQLTTTLTLGSYLLIATAAHDSGALSLIANLLLKLSDNPAILILAMMLSTGILTGIFSAGPTAAAMMPVVIQIANTIFPENKDWIAVAFAASICAGSSLFVHSASAGPILSEKVTGAKLNDTNGNIINWGWVNYLRYGLIHFILQISIAIIWIFFVMDLL